MSERISKLLKGQISASIVFILLGICLIAMPVQQVNIVCKVIFGLFMIVSGLQRVVIYVKRTAAATILDLFTGAVLLVLGLFLFFDPVTVMKLFPVLIGAVIVVDSVWVLQNCVSLKKINRQEWKILLGVGVAFIALGIVLLLSPFVELMSVRATMLFAGWVLLVNGILDIVLYQLLKIWSKAPAVSEPAAVPEENEPMDASYHSVPAENTDSPTEPPVYEEWKNREDAEEKPAADSAADVETDEIKVEGPQLTLEPDNAVPQEAETQDSAPSPEQGSGTDDSAQAGE